MTGISCQFNKGQPATTANGLRDKLLSDLQTGNAGYVIDAFGYCLVFDVRQFADQHNRMAEYLSQNTLALFDHALQAVRGNGDALFAHEKQLRLFIDSARENKSGARDVSRELEKHIAAANGALPHLSDDATRAAVAGKATELAVYKKVADELQDQYGFIAQVMQTQADIARAHHRHMEQKNAPQKPGAKF